MFPVSNPDGPLPNHARPPSPRSSSTTWRRRAAVTTPAPPPCGARTASRATSARPRWRGTTRGACSTSTSSSADTATAGSGMFYADRMSQVSNCLFFCSVLVGLRISCTTPQKSPNLRHLISSDFQKPRHSWGKGKRFNYPLNKDSTKVMHQIWSVKNLTQESFLDLRVEDVDEASLQDDLRRVSEDATAARHAGLPDCRVGVPQSRLDG